MTHPLPYLFFLPRLENTILSVFVLICPLISVCIPACLIPRSTRAQGFNWFQLISQEEIFQKKKTFFFIQELSTLIVLFQRRIVQHIFLKVKLGTSNFYGSLIIKLATSSYYGGLIVKLGASNYYGVLIVKLGTSIYY